MKLLICLVFLLYNIYSLKISTKPDKRHYQFNGNFFWKIGKSNSFKNSNLHRFLFNDYPICVYRDNNKNIMAISDICMHRGAALSYGNLLPNNCIQCPYHGWEYKTGIVNKIPGCPETTKKTFGVPSFETKEVNGDVYICPTYDLNSNNGIKSQNTIYIPPEATSTDFVRIHGIKKIKRPHYLVTENVLDMMHISYVHAFGNQLSPVPFDIHYEDINDYAGKTKFHYNAGPSSMSSIIAKVNEVIVENEFYLPDTTVTRVYAGSLIKTIVTHCYPIGKNESILHFDLYRNFLEYPLFDWLFHYQMDLTLKEDIGIISGIYDNHIRGFMNTKYDITQLKYREKWNKQFINEKKYNEKE